MVPVYSTALDLLTLTSINMTQAPDIEWNKNSKTFNPKKPAPGTSGNRVGSSRSYYGTSSGPGRGTAPVIGRGRGRGISVRGRGRGTSYHSFRILI